MKNKFLKGVFIFFGLLFISFILSFIIYNFNLFKISKNERTIKEIPLSSVQYDGFVLDDSLHADNNTKTIDIDYTGFINKLVIKYKTDENFTFDVKYSGKDYYNKYTAKETSDDFVSKFNTAVISFNDYVDGISIDFSKGNVFEIESININNSIGFNIYLFTFIFFSASALLTIFLYFKYNLFNGKIEKLFLTILLLFGSLFIILQPPLTSFSYDDHIHFSSIYRLFELDGTTDWTESYYEYTKILPFGSGVNTYEERASQNKFLNNKNSIVLSEENSPMITYGQVGYIIPGFVLKVCSVLGLGTVLTILLTKFSMLLVYGLVMYYSIKIIPRGKRILTVFGLFPSMIFLSTQFSYDPPIISFMCLFAAQFISIMESSKDKVGFKEAIILLLSGIIPSFIKVVYAPILLLLLFIPKKKFLSDKHSRVFKIGVVLIFVLLLSTFVFPSVSSGDLGDTRGGNTSVSGQLKTVLKHPLGFASLLKDTALDHFSDKLVGKSTINYYAYVSSLGSNLFVDDVYHSFLILFVLTIIVDSYRLRKYDGEKVVKIFNFIINMSMLFLIWIALYLTFSPVGSLSVSGVQNRYFLPLLMPLILITFSTNKIKVNFDMKKFDSLILLVISLLLMISLYVKFFTAFCL